MLKVGKLYQNITQDDSWPLYCIEKPHVCCGWLKPGDIFVPIAIVASDSPWIEYKILCTGGTLSTVMFSNFDNLKGSFHRIVA